MAKIHVDFLIAVGIKPVKQTNTYALFFTPYRKDNLPFFKVSISKNKWYDLLEMESGNILELGMMVYWTKNITEVIKRLQSFTPIPLSDIPEPMPSSLSYIPLWECGLFF